MQRAMDRARRQALRGRRAVAGLLRSVAPDVPVRGVAVLWSARGNTELVNEWHSMGGVEMVSGSSFDDWLRTLTTAPAPADQRDAAWQLLEARVRAHDQIDLGAARLPTFESRLWTLAIVPAIGAIGAGYALAAWVAVTHDWWLMILGPCLASWVGWILTRWPRLRSIAWGLMFASLVTVVFVAVGLAAVWLRA